MDTRTGLIYKSKDDALDHNIPVRDLMTGTFTLSQLSKRPPRVEPYEPCPCGSGKKFRFCHQKPTRKLNEVAPHKVAPAAG